MSANDTQVAGDHYRVKGDKIQHWDLAVMYQWDPFQYQITKYVMRWKDKHATFEARLTDLKKARHFLDKYIEEAEKYDANVHTRLVATPEGDRGPDYAPSEKENSLIRSTGIEDLSREWHRENSISNRFYSEDDNFQCEGGYGDGTQLYRCRHCRTLVRTPDLSKALQEHGNCAGGGYVAQG